MKNNMKSEAADQPPSKKKGEQIGARAASGARWSMLGQFSRFGSQILSVIILARILTPEDYGLFSVVVAIVGFATLIGDFGLSSAAIQAKEISNQQKSNLLWINGLIGLISAVALILLARPLGDFFDHPMVTPISYVMAINFILVSLTTQFLANITRALKFKLLFLADFLGPLIGLLSAVALAINGAGTWSLVAQQLITNTIILIVLGYGGKWLPNLPRRAPMRKLLSFGIFTFLVQLLTYTSNSISSVLIGRVQSISDAGIYDRAKQINAIPSSQLSAPLARVMLPLLSRVQDNKLQLSAYLAKVQNLLAYIIGAIMISIAIFSELIVKLALGPGWDGVAPILSILSLGGFFTALGFVLQWGFMVTGKVRIQLSFSIVTRSLMIIFLIFAVPYGVTAVAVASSLGLMFNWIVLYFLALPRTGIAVKLLWLQLLRPTISHLIVFFFCFFAKILMEHSHFSATHLWIALIVIFTGSYVAIFVLVPLVRRDIIDIRNQIFRKASS